MKEGNDALTEKKKLKIASFLYGGRDFPPQKNLS
jgi:hypothetical protein